MNNDCITVNRYNANDDGVTAYDISYNVKKRFNNNKQHVRRGRPVFSIMSTTSTRAHYTYTENGKLVDFRYAVGYKTVMRSGERTDELVFNFCDGE